MIKWALRITVFGVLVSIVSPDSIPNTMWALDRSLSLMVDGLQGVIHDRIVNGAHYWATEGWKHPTRYTLGSVIIKLIKGLF